MSYKIDILPPCHCGSSCPGSAEFFEIRLKFLGIGCLVSFPSPASLFIFKMASVQPVPRE